MEFRFELNGQHHRDSIVDINWNVCFLFRCEKAFSELLLFNELLLSFCWAQHYYADGENERSRDSRDSVCVAGINKWKRHEKFIFTFSELTTCGWRSLTTEATGINNQSHWNWLIFQRKMFLPKIPIGFTPSSIVGKWNSHKLTFWNPVLVVQTTQEKF